MEHKLATFSTRAPPPAMAWARCTRPECPCTSSWNGKEGEYCGRACQQGKPCVRNFHRRPRPLLAAIAQSEDVPGTAPSPPPLPPAPPPSDFPGPSSPPSTAPPPVSRPPLSPHAPSFHLFPSADFAMQFVVNCVRCNLLFDAGLYRGTQPTCRQCRSDLLHEAAHRADTRQR